MLDIIAEIERITDDLEYVEPEDVEDSIPDLCSRLRAVIDALIGTLPKGDTVE